MKLLLDPRGIGIQLGINTESARFHEVWLVEALKVAWDVWIRLGWSVNTQNVRENDWNRFIVPDETHRVIADITRFNRLTEDADFDINTSFSSGWELILQILMTLDGQNIGLAEAYESFTFRNKVATFLAAGIKRGLQVDNPLAKEEFLFPARDAFYAKPVHCPIDFHAHISANVTEAIVTLQAPLYIPRDHLADCRPTFIII